MQKFRKNLKNKISRTSRRMRGGGGGVKRKDLEPDYYGIVVGPGGHHFIEGFYLTEENPQSSYCVSSEEPPNQMSLEITRWVQTIWPPRSMFAVDHIDRAVRVAGINRDITDPKINRPNFRLSTIQYLYVSRDDAEIALRDLLLPAAVHATGHVIKTVSDKAKALLQPKAKIDEWGQPQHHGVSFTPSEKTTAHVLGGIRKQMIGSLLKPGQLSPKSYAKMIKSITRAPPTSGGSHSRRRRRRCVE